MRRRRSGWKPTRPTTALFHSLPFSLLFLLGIIVFFLSPSSSSFSSLWCCFIPFWIAYCCRSHFTLLMLFFSYCAFIFFRLWSLNPSQCGVNRKKNKVKWEHTQQQPQWTKKTLRKEKITQNIFFLMHLRCAIQVCLKNDALHGLCIFTVVVHSNAIHFLVENSGNSSITF